MAEQTHSAIPTVLVIDDEPDIVDMIASYFESRQMHVVGGGSGADLRRLLREASPDLVLLDLGLPGENGIDLAREVREHSALPLIIVSGRDATVEKVVALELGADDYVTKPFELAELYARSRSVLRRAQPNPHGGASPTLCFEGFSFHPEQRSLIDADGRAIELTAGELQLLELLLSHPHRVLSRDQLLEWTHGRMAGPFDRSVDMQVARLRRKLGDDPSSPRLIKTVRGAGYWFSPTVTRA
jgi:two-component system, OmpR family, response regulator